MIPVFIGTGFKLNFAESEALVVYADHLEVTC